MFYTIVDSAVFQEKCFCSVVANLIPYSWASVFAFFFFLAWEDVIGVMSFSLELAKVPTVSIPNSVLEFMDVMEYRQVEFIRKRGYSPEE